MSNLYFDALGHISWAAMPANMAALFGVAAFLAIPAAMILAFSDNNYSNDKDNNMTSNSNDKTATAFNIFSILRGLGYKVVDGLVAVPELAWIVGKELTVQSVDFAVFALKDLLSGIKLTMQIAILSLIMGVWLPVAILVGTAIAAKDAAVSGYRKVTGWFATKKAARAAAKAEAEAKAEAARIEELKADAKLIGMVTSEEVAEMIDAVMALVKTSNKELQNTIAMMDSTLPAMPLADLKPIVAHAKAVVLKSIEDMSLAEMREELGLKGFNRNQLRVKVRAAREEVPEANNL
jgi:hypothetical protein